jgi:hypothetical protein
VLEALRLGDHFRFANRLRAWIEVEGDEIVDWGYHDRSEGLMGATRLAFGGGQLCVAAVALPDLRLEPRLGDGCVTFTQTAGGRTGVPFPRAVDRPPFVQVRAPLVWSTLVLTIHADGLSEGAIGGASPYPRHWVYDERGRLVAKTGLADFREWAKHTFGRHTPWGDQESKALVTAVETALERQLSVTIMSGGARPQIRTLKEGEYLVHQGDRGDSLFLLLDGVLSVTIDGEPVAEVGPGVVLGERAVLEAGIRTASLQATTPVRVAVAPADRVDHEALLALREHHRIDDT